MSQHDPETGPFEVQDYLMTACIAWEIAGCPCCAPSVLDEALEGLSEEDWRRLDVFAAALLSAAQYRRDEQAGCTCPETMEPCPVHNHALAGVLAARQEPADAA